jgi:hypothetical protein
VQDVRKFPWLQPTSSGAFESNVRQQHRRPLRIDCIDAPWHWVTEQAAFAAVKASISEQHL